MFQPFEGPRLKLERSQQHFDVLKSSIAAYAERVQYGFREVSKPDAEMIQLVFLFSEPPPSELPLLVGDSIHNLRSALDLMIADIARLRSVSTERLAFPFAKSEPNLQKEIKSRKLVQLGDDIVAKITQLKPYAGGNQLLYALNEFDIADKHHMVAPVFQAVPFDEIHVGNFSMIGMTTPMQHGSKFTVRRGTPFKLRRQGGVTAIFPSRSPLPLAPVVETFAAMADLVASIIDSFDAGLRPEGHPPSQN